jgi:hypothetical protein
MGRTVSGLLVEGHLALGTEDQARWAAYVDEFVRHDGMTQDEAADTACRQIAQDLLGGMGFVVSEAEPVPQ